MTEYQCDSILLTPPELASPTQSLGLSYSLTYHRLIFLSLDPRRTTMKRGLDSFKTRHSQRFQYLREDDSNGSPALEWLSTFDISWVEIAVINAWSWGDASYFHNMISHTGLMPAEIDVYLYRTLAEGYIRLVELFSDSVDAPFRCRIFLYRLKEISFVPFKALLYI